MISLSDLSLDNYLMPIHELIELYKDSTPKIEIKPQYQRKFRWLLKQKTNFIESIILWYPIPSVIFYHDSKSWKYEVIDWLQRIWTILELFWELKSDFFINNSNSIWIKWLWKWDLIDFKKIKNIDELPEDYKNKILTYNINVIEVVDIENEQKYDIFCRLNSWWTPLKPQEIRNNNLIKISDWFFDSLESTINWIDTRKIFNLSDNDLIEYKDYEYILRIFIPSKFDNIISNNIKYTIDKWLKLLNKDDVVEKDKLINLLSVLIEVFWEYPFKNYKNIKTSFYIPTFDFLSFWLYKNYDKFLNLYSTKDVKRIEDFKNKIISFLSSDDFEKKTWVWKWSSIEKYKYCYDKWITFIKELLENE